MNDLLPPDRRSIPERRRALMRERLDNEIGTTTMGDRRDGAARRFGIPALVAAAVAALAIGGYVVASGGDDGSTDPSPAGQGDKGPQGDGQQNPAADRTSTAMSDPDPAYQQCIDLALEQYELRGEPITEDLTGRLAIEDGTGTTVVVANSTDSYTCNIKPDEAVSNRAPFDADADAEAFWFAMNQYRGGEYAWAGGRLPDGVTGVSYAFPDGHTEDAVVRDGFWAMQYFSDDQIAEGLDWPSKVEVNLGGPNGRTILLDYTAQCNQVSHGC
jgi:hypothetical protein